ncbi:MAG: ATP-binding cassette domain-containing protein, partial [Flavobacteriaceae bacterium]
FLFSESIADNIRFGKKDATLQEIEQAAKMANVHENIIGFAEGYDTELGERGVTLSGGQIQRVSIARALIKNPEILLLDDCLSAVDTDTEEKILSNLKQIRSNKTTLIISHRVTSVLDADHIIVLKDGKIIQEGGHAPLLNKKGYYQDLFHKQQTENAI